MKNPNGYGSVVKLSGNRRKPYVVRKTRGFDGRGYPIYEIIGYFVTHEEALVTLAAFNCNPYDIAKSKITVKELYELWEEKKMFKMSKSSQSNLKSAMKHCKTICNMKYRELRSYHMQDCIDNCGCGYSTQGAIKALFGHLDKFALELDVIQKPYSALVSAAPIPDTTKQPFTDNERKALWEALNEAWVDSVLFLIFSGWRITEMLTLETANIDITNLTMKGGIKTESGKGRIIPIHSAIVPIVKKRYEEGNKYLFSINGKKCANHKYYEFWNTIMTRINAEHTPHECRHTFRSRLDSAGANKVCIDMMMGHKSKEVGERVYTHKTIEELRNAIELVSR